MKITKVLCTIILGTISLGLFAQNAEKQSDASYKISFTEGLNKVNFLSEGTRMAGNLFVPANYREDGKLKAIVVVTPAGGVKEQTAGIYAEKLSKQGFIALAFDHRTFGESGGLPRTMENAPMKVEDIKNAISFIRTVAGVDRDNIGLLGICSGSGYSIQTTIFDDRIKALATVSGYNDFVGYGLSGATQYGDVLTGDGIEQFQQQMKMASDARQKYYETGEVIYVDAIPVKGSGRGVFWDRAADYYRNPERGAVDNYSPLRAAISLDTRYFFNALEHMNLMRDTPFLAVAGSVALSIGQSEAAVKNAIGDKELFKVKDATHFDLYDQDWAVDQAIEKLNDFYGKKLK